MRRALKVCGWLALLPLRLLWGLVCGAATALLFLVAAAEDGGDADAERGRRNWLGRHHPTAHLPRHNR